MTQEQRNARNQAKLEEWLSNARRNAHKVERDVMEVSSFLPDRKTAVVFAAGASLKQYEDKVARIARSCITIVSPTVAHWFIKHAGRQPDLLINVDKHEMLPDMAFDNGVDAWTPILLSPVVHPNWTRDFGNLYWFLNIIHDDEGSFENHPYTWALTSFFPDIKTKIAQMGCVTIEAIWLMFLLQAKTSIQNIVLAGGDFSFWHGLARVPRNEEEDYQHIDDFIEEGVDDDRTQWRGILTNKRMLSYVWQLATIQQQAFIRLWNMSDGPANTFLPRVKVSTVINGGFPKYWSDGKVKAACTDFIEKYNKIYQPINMRS